jgi:ABC-type Fe3+-hydroxamate transport system substrate-binding protein
LKLSGGINVAAESGITNYATIDRETLAKLSPRMILQLMPDATPQLLRKCQDFWATAADVPAVKAGKVFPITASYALTPGARVGDLAERFAAILHPALATTTAYSRNPRPKSPDR